MFRRVQYIQFYVVSYILHVIDIFKFRPEFLLIFIFRKSRNWNQLWKIWFRINRNRNAIWKFRFRYRKTELKFGKSGIRFRFPKVLSGRTLLSQCMTDFWVKLGRVTQPYQWSWLTRAIVIYFGKSWGEWTQCYQGKNTGIKLGRK